ncbi:MAG: hypothetical protein ABJA67_01475, partial [Chthonomonadales bacterium]
MISLLNLDRAGFRVLPLPSGIGDNSGSDGTCFPCAAYRPAPELDGNLQIDPEIHLPSPGMDVDISYFYNASDSYNGPFGYGRTLSHNLRAQASGSPTVVTLTHGNGDLATYQYDAVSGNYLCGTPGVFNTLVKDVPNSLWKETTPNGYVTAYPLDTVGNVTTATYIQDPVGNTHTLAYSSGLLSSIQDAVGRFVTLSYSSGLLQSIQDWAQRRTTFAYDAVTFPALPVLTTVTGPTGCNTQYQYSAPNGLPLVMGIVDPNGYGTSYTYDQQNRVVNRTVASIGVTTYLYQPGAMIAVNALGVVTTQNSDANFNLTGTVDPGTGGVNTFTYNANRQETSRQNAQGAFTTTTYDASGNATKLQDALGYITTYQVDAFNNTTTVTYADGGVTAKIYGYGGSPFDT